MGFASMEIDTVTRRPPGLSPRWRACVIAAMLLPVTLFAVVPTLLGLERYVLTGSSMEGSLARGSVVLERRVPIADLRAGDVITFEPPSGFAARGLVTHRVLSVDTDGILTQGDANHFRDPWVLPPQAQSRVELAVPYVGYPFLPDVDRRVWLLVVMAALALALAVGLARGALGTRRHRSSLASVARGGPG